MPIVSSQEWDQFVALYPQAHLLQTSTWGAFKAAFGWQVYRVVSGDSGAQILMKNLPLGLKWAYIPKGPVGENWEKLWPEVDKVCRQNGVMFLKVEPDLWEDKTGPYFEGNVPSGFRLSPHEIQPRRTLVVDLDQSEDEILANMKQKTRYNIRLSARKGVKVRESQDIETFYELLETTGERETFGVHSRDYYQQAYDWFSPLDQCALLVAEFEGEPLASLMVFAKDDRAWYFYGASSNVHRNLMPTYLLQWEAIRWARRKGCKRYDLWGVPDAEEDILEAEFTNHQDGLWGVYRFKRGFGGRLRRAVQPWDRVYRVIFYYFYHFWVKKYQN
jgi:lipid II:glycine glycyltransferase (peptidoglycan interpeptide bridge formation enzyme)